jgi:3,4-dihydroxy 2-butanone 4-phosphate synthase / GTP cyclohydrolase II
LCADVESEEIEKMAFLSIEDAVQELKQGKLLIVTDDQDRENEGDFIAIAETITPDMVNFMSKYGRGLICTPMIDERLKELDLPLMVDRNTARHGTAFTVSVDAVRGTTTGISAFDRAVTIRSLADPKSRPDDFARPGHIFPLMAAKGGVLRRAGHTEAVIDLARLAGFQPIGVLCEILDDDGTMARTPKLLEIAREHDLGMLTIADLIDYRRRNEKLVRQVVDIDFPSKWGQFRLHLYQSELQESEHHLAIVKGEIGPEDEPLVRVHSQCLTGDILGSLRCDCRDQLNHALRRIEEEGKGVVLYMRQEGRGIGLANKLKAYKLQDEGLDTVEANHRLGFPADARDYGIGAQILVDLGVRKMRLMTNNPKKIIGLDGYGLRVVERVPVEVGRQERNARYLQTKKDKLGHLLNLD